MNRIMECSHLQVFLLYGAVTLTSLSPVRLNMQQLRITVFVKYTHKEHRQDFRLGRLVRLNILRNYLAVRLLVKTY